MLTLIPLTGFPLVKVGDDLPELIRLSLIQSDIQLLDGDIIVLAQKIVSKAEGRLRNLSQIQPSERALDLSQKTGKDPRFLELVLMESNEVLRTRPGTIIVEHRLGFVCANAGIDHSNVGTRGELWVLLLPEDPDESARKIRTRLEAMAGVKIGVMIIDSHGRAWRLGTQGMAIGVSGIPGVVDLRGKPDLFSRILQITQVAVGDELASAASLVMGQAAEGTPVIHVRGFPYPLREATLEEFIRPQEQDLFR